MSLIGDALRRKQEEAPATPPAEPVVSAAPETQPRATLSLRGRHAEEEASPADPPTGESNAKPPKKRRPKKHTAWFELVVVIVGLIILVGLGALLYLMYFAPATGPAPSAPGTTPTAAQPASTPAVAEPVAPPEAATVLATLPATEEVQPADPTVEVPVESEPLPATPIPPPPEPPAPPSAVETKPTPVIWPTFSLQAAMGSGTRGSVMINGQIIPTGSQFGDITILEITPKGVVMEYDGERRTFRVRR